MSKPSSFCTICTNNCSFELVGLLLSLSIYHTNEIIHILCDTKTKNTIDNMSPQPKLRMFFYLELDKYDGLNRMSMEKKNIFGEFLKNKMKIINYALKSSNNTLLLDSDIIITDTINNIDITKDVGLSPQFISEQHINKTGFYNAGMLWCKSTEVSNYWSSIIENNNSCPEQINMIKLKKFNYFDFDENYNLQCWRYYLSPEGNEQIKNNITSIANDKLYYKNKPLKFIHTHFLDKRFDVFNGLIIQHLKNAKMYKLLAIISRVIKNKWILKIPKQPLPGLGRHNNDSYRELPILMKLKNKDVDLIYDDKTIHCWLEPNILTYDRPTLEWVNNEVDNSSLLLLGNGDVNVEGKQIKNKFKNMNVKPWIFWPRKPMLMEKILKENKILTYDERTIESIFIGNIENSVQNVFRKDTSWKDVLTEYYCTQGQKHLFSHNEYLMKLRNSKYGLCLRGYGSKCHREVELMALGSVPIITENVSVTSYLEPLVENTHYLKATNPEDFKNKINNVTQEQWNSMSKSCYEWYQRNVHSDNCWNNMINYILYS